MVVIQVVGVPGVGKSIISKAAASQTGFEYLDSSSYILERSREYGLKIASLDDIPKIEEKILIKMLFDFRDFINRASKHKDILLVTHINPKVGNLGYWIPSPTTVAKRNLAGLIVVIAKPEDIIRFRKGNANRYRSLDDPFKIYIDQEIILTASIMYASLLQVPLKLVMNKHGALKDTINEVVEFLKIVQQIGPHPFKKVSFSRIGKP
jgi:adenylate kinase